MKYLYQMMIIGTVTFTGEMLNHLLPLSVPGSVYGMVLLFICLLVGIIKEEQIKDVAGWLLAVMPVTFIGPAVGVTEYYGSIRHSLPLFAVIVFVTTVLVMVVTGLVSQGVIRIQKRRGGEHE